jgi:hypothetical protein
MAQTLTLETMVIQQETRRTAEILFVPAATLRLADLQLPIDAAEIVGLQPGVPVTTLDEIQDVLFASLAGRIYPFDEGSFDRWRPQRLASSGSADAVFAEQLATQKLVPVSSPRYTALRLRRSWPKERRGLYPAPTCCFTVRFKASACSCSRRSG